MGATSMELSVDSTCSVIIAQKQGFPTTFVFSIHSNLIAAVSIIVTTIQGYWQTIPFSYQRMFPIGHTFKIWGIKICVVKTNSKLCICICFVFVCFVSCFIGGFSQDVYLCRFCICICHLYLFLYLCHLFHQGVFPRRDSAEAAVWGLPNAQASQTDKKIDRIVFFQNNHLIH